jgi:hypothetical protein
MYIEASVSGGTRNQLRSHLVKTLLPLFIIALVAVSCSRGVSRIQTHPVPRPNPTSWSFPFPLELVRAQALEAFSIEHQARDRVFGRPAGPLHMESTLFPECATNAVFSETLFRDAANTNDIYLHSLHSPFTLSAVYRGRNGGLPFMAAFHLHLSPDGPNTRVSVTALDPEVINGEKFGFGSCGPGYGWNCEKVKPTSVEEYVILRYLGRCLGVTNMPKIILPET